MKPAMTSGLITFQILSCEVIIRCQDPAVEQTFEYMVGRARQPIDVRQRLNYQVLGNTPYDIIEEGDRLSRVGETADVLHVVYNRVYRRVLERFTLSGWLALHAALATINGCRTLILGDKGAGKTTLATRLLYQGHPVEGDEMVLVRGSQALPLIRPFHFKPGIEQHIPQLAGAVEDLPKMFAGPVGISAFDPSRFGFDWTIGTGPVDRVVWIRANHGGETRLERHPSFVTIQQIFTASLVWSGSRTAMVATASKLGGDGGCELILGDAAQAVHLLESTSF